MLSQNTPVEPFYEVAIVVETGVWEKQLIQLM